MCSSVAALSVDRSLQLAHCVSQLYTVYTVMVFSLGTLHGLENKIQKLSDLVSQKVKCGNMEKLNLDSLNLKLKNIKYIDTQHGDISGNCCEHGISYQRV